MSEPWTPGPWRAEMCSDECGTWVVVGGTVDVVHGRLDGFGGVLRDADARLISLAPEMAELLEKTAAVLVYAKNFPRANEEDLGRYELALVEVRDILARARGDN